MHSDNGASMKAAKTQSVLTNHGVKFSHSRPRVSNDNPYSESFFRTLKYNGDYLYPRDGFESLEHAQKWLDDFIEHYNEKHRHGGIRMVTPGSRFRGEDVEILRRRRETMLRARQQARAFGIKASEPFFRLMNMRQVTIAAVNGFALGGGCEISMACDIRIASENAIFGQPETGLGIIPGFGGTQRLARLVGMGRAKEMIFTCDNVDAAEAYRIGLVNKVVAKEELMPTAKAMAAKIISKGSYAISVAKAAINNGYDMDIKNAVEMEANLFGVVNDTNDKKEGMGAFLEKRSANLTDF